MISDSLAKWCCISVMLPCAIVMANGLQARTVRVYGPQQGVLQHSHDVADVQYVLQLASFKNERDADRYCEWAESTLHQAVVSHKILRRNQVFHRVMVASLLDQEQVKRLSQQLLSAAPPSKKKQAWSTETSVKPSINDEHALHSLDWPSLHWPQVMTASIGPGWGMNSHSNQTFFLQPDIQKTYTAPASQWPLLSGDFFVGWQTALNSRLLGQAGISVGASTDAKLQGDIWEDADPAFNNYQYTERLSHVQLSLEGKVLMDTQTAYMPYVSGRVGVSFNELNQFTIDPLISEEVPAPVFQSGSTTAFTYSASVGVLRKISSNWQLGVGYLFSDWGRSTLSPASGETYSNAPGLNHFYVNSLVFHVSYVS